MPKVLFDFTRIISALDLMGAQIEKRPELFIWDLSKMLEAIVLYDTIYTTGGKDYFGMLDSTRCRFNIKSKLYDSLFDKVIKRIPLETDEKIQDRFERIKNKKNEDSETGKLRYIADLSMVNGLVKEVDFSSFQFVPASITEEVFISERDKVLASLERVRINLHIANILHAPYDPCRFRIPLVEKIGPANLESFQLLLYKQFEKKIQDCIRKLGRIRFPLIFDLVLRECRDGYPDDLFQVALELRGDPAMRQLREAMRDFIGHAGAPDLEQRANARRVLLNEARGVINRLSGKPNSIFNMQLKVGILPSIGISANIPELWARAVDRKNFPAFTCLARLTREALKNFIDARGKLNGVLKTSFSEDDIFKLPLERR